MDRFTLDWLPKCWEKEGQLQAHDVTPGRHRRYDLVKLKPELFRTEKSNRMTVAYARVSSHDQRDDLERQKQVLELYCARQGWTYEVVSDLGSGMNYHYHKNGLIKRVIDDATKSQNHPASE